MDTRPGSRVLFLDLEAVQSRHNVVQTVCEAEKHPSNPLLPLGEIREWDTRRASPWAARTVIYDDKEGIFKCWYDGGDFAQDEWCATGYAVSEDGIVWDKPTLGLFEYYGSKDNNICNLGIGPVIKDTAEKDPEKRYKMMLKFPRPQPVRINYSPDGIHWREGPRVNIPDLILNDVVVLLRDEQDPDPDRRYKLVWQIKHPPSKPGPSQVRAKSIAFGPDVEHFTESEDNPVLSPDGGLEDENHFLMLAPYAGMYVMAYEYGWYVPNKTGLLNRYRADIRLAVSRDGEHYQRVQPHQKTIPRGRPGEWDDGFLVISDKPVIVGDKIYLYYAGGCGEWTDWCMEDSPRDEWVASGKVGVFRTGLATLRIDGFTCLETADRETPGHMVTQPVEVTDRDSRLILNVGDVRQGDSWIEVEVLDAERDEVLGGFQRQDCGDVCRDGIRVPVSWKGGSIGQAGCSSVRLRFWLYGASRLYSFGIEGG